MNSCFRHIYLLVFVATIGFISTAQNSTLDSLTYELKQNLNKDTNRVKALEHLGDYYKDIANYEEAITQYENALKINLENNSAKGIAQSYLKLGFVYKIQGNYPLAFEFYNKALNLSREIKDDIGISMSLSHIGVLHKNQKNYDKALEYHNEALAITVRTGNKAQLSSVNMNIGVVHMRQDNYQLAEIYLTKSLTIAKEIGDLQKASSCLNNLGDVYLYTNKITEARKNYEEAKAINSKFDNQLSLSNSYLGIGFSYIEEDNFSQAIPNILKSMEIAEKMQLLDFKRDGHYLLYHIYKTKGEFEKALFNHEQYKLLSDEVTHKSNIEKMTQLDYEYKYMQEIEDAKNREYILTKTVTATSQDLQKSQRNSLIAVILVLLISLISGGFIFFLKLKQVKAENKNIKIQQKLLRSQMTPHFMFNSLSILQGLMLHKEEKKSISYLSQFSKLLRITLENSRHITVSLASELDALNSYMTLQNIDANPPLNYQLTIDPSIDDTKLSIAPMLIQPFVENAVEHAFVGQKEQKDILVKLSFKEKQLVCTITDNGIGINVDKKNFQEKKNSLATTITSERLEILSKEFKVPASVKIENRKLFGEKGTLVTLVLPYKINQNV